MFMQKAGLLDFKTDITVGDGRCNRWLAPETDSLAPERGNCFPRDSVGPRCKNSAWTLNIFLWRHCMPTHRNEDFNTN